MNFLSRKDVEKLREEYPSGTRVILDNMEDPYTYISPGTMGTVCWVDDSGTIHVKWDTGHQLGLIVQKDSFRKA